jgi:hypothetical protein
MAMLLLGACAGGPAPPDGFALPDVADLPGSFTPDSLTGDAGGGGDAVGCQPVLGFKTCAEPIEVTEAGGQFCGDTSMTMNLYTLTVNPAQGCDRPSTEPEYVFRIALATAATVNIRAHGNFRMAIYLRTGCIDATTQIACAQSVAAGDPAVIDKSLAAGVYSLFVDGAGEPTGPGTNRGPFTLSIDIQP